MDKDLGMCKASAAGIMGNVSACLFVCLFGAFEAVYHYAALADPELLR